MSPTSRSHRTCILFLQDASRQSKVVWRKRESNTNVASKYGFLWYYMDSCDAMPLYARSNHTSLLSLVVIIHSVKDTVSKQGVTCATDTKDSRSMDFPFDFLIGPKFAKLNFPYRCNDDLLAKSCTFTRSCRTSKSSIVIFWTPMGEGFPWQNSTTTRPPMVGTCSTIQHPSNMSSLANT